MRGAIAGRRSPLPLPLHEGLRSGDRLERSLQITGFENERRQSATVLPLC